MHNPLARQIPPQVVVVGVVGSIIIMAIVLLLCWCCIKHNGQYGEGTDAQDEESKPNIYSFPTVQFHSG